MVCEMDGDYQGALNARKMELESSISEWNSATGESVDFVRREIARLEQLM